MNIKNLCKQKSVDTRGAGLTDKIWPNGKTVYVWFMDGDEWLHKEVMRHASEWSKYANVKFKEADTALGSDIRVTFNCSGAWSYIGRDAESISKNAPTMCLGVIPAYSKMDDRKAIVMHEFGHALGMIHEHQSPSSSVQFDAKAVLEYYREHYGWDENTIKYNLLEKQEGATAYSMFDKDSIMVYEIPDSVTVDGKGVGKTAQLSETDKKVIGKMYPFEDLLR